MHRGTVRKILEVPAMTRRGTGGGIGFDRDWSSQSSHQVQLVIIMQRLVSMWFDNNTTEGYDLQEKSKWEDGRSREKGEK